MIDVYVYHLMPYTSKTPNEISPRIPTHVMIGEDDLTPRICVSKSIDGCLTAIGAHEFAISFLADTIKENGIQKDTPLERLLFPFVIRTYDVGEQDEAFWDTKKLSVRIPDAKYTQECWITKDIEPIKVEILWLIDSDFSIKPLTIDGESMSYPVIQNAVWSNTPELPTIYLKYKSFEIAKRVLLQNGELELAAAIKYRNYFRKDF